MPVINRELDQSQQRDHYTTTLFGTPSGISAGILNPGVSTGTTFPLFVIPYPASIASVGEVAWGLSGTPVHSLWVYRFAGGFTSFVCGQTLTVTAFGTSGVLGGTTIGYSILAGTAATLPLQAGDELVLYAQGSNAACAQVQINMAVRALQDIKTDFNL